MYRRNDFRPRLERLEDRLALAGNVAASLSSGQLNVYGDGAANDITVFQSGGTITITGAGGTTVNGGPSVSFLASQLEQAEFKMEGGDDHVFLIAVQVNNDLVIDMGAGNDVAEASNVQTGANFLLNGGQGDDLIGVANTTVGGDMDVAFEDGKATLYLTRASISKNLSVTTKDANDYISIEGGITVGEDVNIETGKGNDIVNVADSNLTPNPVQIGKSLSIATDEGKDTVRLIRVVVGEDINVNTGKGNDTVVLTNVNTSKSLTVDTSDGNDKVTASMVHAAADAVFLGGAGLDTLDDNGITAGIKKEIKEFELFI